MATRGNFRHGCGNRDCPDLCYAEAARLPWPLAAIFHLEKPTVNEITPVTLTRARIVTRLLFTLLYAAIFAVVKFLILVTTVFQFIYLLVALKHSEPVRVLANKLVSYAYRVWRYITLNTNVRPFPFAGFPEELEPPESAVSFE
jgi:hypothetical protein